MKREFQLPLFNLPASQGGRRSDYVLGYILDQQKRQNSPGAIEEEIEQLNVPVARPIHPPDEVVVNTASSHEILREITERRKDNPYGTS